METKSSAAFELSPVCHVQTAEKRFGRHVLADLRDWVQDGPAMTAPGDTDSDGDEDTDEDDASDASLSPPLWNDGDFDFAGWNANNTGSAPNTGPPPFEDGNTETDPTHDSNGFPKVARVRSNLTVLSQRYNLYFAAYQDKIYVYQPQRAPSILPAVSLILHPPRTKSAKVIGGTLDRYNGHMMNHIVVGDFGSLEVLLLAYDDGDVIGYFTHWIAHTVATRKGSASQTASGTRPSHVRPFFHDNVGISAWGLAIHKQSRLFAVSSNKHEVTVFAFATSDDERELSSSEVRDSWKTAAQRKKDDDSPIVWSGQTALELERHFQSRTRNWRIVLPFGLEGHNAPNIAFCDGPDGNADKVVAVDVRGNTWILDIWKIGGFPTVLQPNVSRGGDYGDYMGWGVLVLPDSSFRCAPNNEAAMGLTASEVFGTNQSIGDGICNDIWLDTTCSLFRVKDNAADVRAMLTARHGNKYELRYRKANTTSTHAQSPPTQQLASLLLPVAPTVMPPTFQAVAELFTLHSPFGSPSSESPFAGSSVPASEDESLAQRWAPILLYKDKPPKGSKIDIGVEREKYGFLSARTIVPTFGQTFDITNQDQLQYFYAQSMQRKTRSHSESLTSACFDPDVAHGVSILRTTRTGVELQSLDSGSASILCRDVLPQHNHHQRRPTPYDLSVHLCERISMLHHVPELGLVVLGSLNGRVALLSLTKPPQRHRFSTRARDDGCPIPRAFKVEAILPRRSDEDKRLRPWVALHGIAVSRAPQPKPGSLELQNGEGRGDMWRLILHYMDHTILMYDLTRRLDADELLIL